MLIFEPITPLSYSIPIGTPVYNKLGKFCGLVISHVAGNMYKTDTNKHFIDNWLGTYGFPKSYKFSDIDDWGREVGFRIKPLFGQFCPKHASFIISKPY